MAKSTKKATGRQRATLKKLPARAKEMTRKESQRVKGGAGVPPIVTITTTTGLPQITAITPRGKWLPVITTSTR